MGGYAWVTLATNDSYSLGALVLAHSLKKSNTAHKLAVLITPAVAQPMREQLQTVFDVVKTVDVLDSKDEAHLALMKRPELGITFTKIHCWRLTEFEKCVFLDADTLVVRNSDELFEREEFSAAPDVSWPDCFNSGVFVYKPSVETFDKLLQFAVEKGSFDGGDQGLLNQFFSDWATEDIKKHLPFVYNLTSVAAYSYIPAFKHYGAETRIVHFIGTGKPWLQQLDPVTRTITPTSGSEHLTPLLQQWWDLFCEKVHPNLSKNLENNNDGMSHPPAEACSNTPVALISDEPQSPRLIEPCLQYREKDDYRQHNLPYQPFDVRGSSGELLNIEFLLASVVPPNDPGEQQRQDENKMEEKNTNPEVQEQPKDAEQTEPKVVDDKIEKKEEEPPTPKDPFDYDTFIPDEKCINDYLEKNVLTYQPFEAPKEDPQPENIPLPRFLTMPQDDQRQQGNTEAVEHQPVPEPPPPPAPPTIQKKPPEVQSQPTPPFVEKHELPKPKSMTLICSDGIATVTPQPPQRSIWKSQPNLNVELNRKYSMPKLKPLLPRQDSKSIQPPVSRVTAYTEFLMSADYKDPVDLPKDEVGFVETELRRSKFKADSRGKFGPLPYTKSPEVKILQPKKTPLRELNNDIYDLTRCKRQLGNKPKDDKKENVALKSITSAKEKKSTLIKKRKSKEVSPSDGEKEKPIKRGRKDRQRNVRNENVDEILKRLWEFSKNYQHYFGVDTQNGTKETFVRPEYKRFRNFVKDQKETTKKGLLGIPDIMTGPVNGTKVRNESMRCITNLQVPEMINGLDKTEKKTAVVTRNSEIKIRTEKFTEEQETLISDRCKISNEKHPDQTELTNNGDGDKLGTDDLTLENIPNAHDGTEDEVRTGSQSKNVENVESHKNVVKSNGKVFTDDVINHNNNATKTNSIRRTNVKEIITLNGSTPKQTSNGCISFPKTCLKSLTQLNSPENRKVALGIAKHSQSDSSSTGITKDHEKEDSLSALRSQAFTAVTNKPTRAAKSSQLLDNAVRDEKATKVDCSKSQEQTKDSSSTRKNERNLVSTQPGSERVEIGKDKDDQLKTAVFVKETKQVESPAQPHTTSEKFKVLQEDAQLSAGANQKGTSGTDNLTEHNETAQEAIPQERSSSQAPVEESTESSPKGIFTIDSPERSTKVKGEGDIRPSGIGLSNGGCKLTGEIPSTLKVGGSIPEPDEILCVPDFETPRSSRILTPVPKTNTDATPPPLATSRKARLQRKPYENGAKNRCSPGKRIETGDGKHCVGIAGAIAQLNLEAGGKAADSESTSAAHQEYIRRQNWETGNIDYMGRDSFENIWSKICQTLEGKESDKATENTMTISTEEKTKPEGTAGPEAPVLLPTIQRKYPEFIDTLPSEPLTGPVEDDEIIFSKPETRQTCLTNIKEEEENGGPAEGGGGVKLSDILSTNEMMKPLIKTDGIVNAQESPAVAPEQPDRVPSEQAKPEEKTQTTSTPLVETVTTAPVPSDLAKEENKQVQSGVEPQAQTGETNKSETEINPPGTSEKPKCTTVAIRRLISATGESYEDRTSEKTRAQKIAEKKLQQKPNIGTEPIPLSAPGSPTQTECKTVAIPYPPIMPAPVDETQAPVAGTPEAVSLPPAEVPGEAPTSQASSKDEKQKKGVFSKLLEMVGVAPKVEELSKSVFYTVEGEAPKEEGSGIIEPNTVVEEVNKEVESLKPQDEPKNEEPDLKPDDRVKGQTVIKDADKTSEPEIQQESKSSIPDTEKTEPDLKNPEEGERKTTNSGKKGPKSGQAPIPKPARNASPKSSAQASEKKSPSPLTIPQTPPETAFTVATPTPPPEPPKRRNSALLKVDESIPVTPPVPELQKETTEPVKSEIENMIEIAKTEVESIMQERRTAEEEANENNESINAMKLIMGEEGQETKPKEEETEELKVTSEEERQRHKGEAVSSKLSDQILKAIPPPRRKTISESKSEASGSGGAIPKAAPPSGEKPKQKPSSIPVPPPRNKGKPSTPAPPKGKTKK